MVDYLIVYKGGELIPLALVLELYMMQLQPEDNLGSKRLESFRLIRENKKYSFAWTFKKKQRVLKIEHFQFSSTGFVVKNAFESKSKNHENIVFLATFADWRT